MTRGNRREKPGDENNRVAALSHFKMTLLLFVRGEEGSRGGQEKGRGEEKRRGEEKIGE